PSVRLNRLSRLLRRVLLSSTMATLIMVSKDGKYFDKVQSDVYMNFFGGVLQTAIISFTLWV
ncbi:MAG TPA: hypothetical protein VGM31_19430, partial [Puia sp.]